MMFLPLPFGRGAFPKLIILNAAAHSLAVNTPPCDNRIDVQQSKTRLLQKHFIDFIFT